ncbi:MAG TPA: TlpA disulfide reductase family protein [Verrucomicrobiae bacterium]|nr:TlpA disulfide reductase family protein [Verrucomicrobiae bacterium]
MRKAVILVLVVGLGCWGLRQAYNFHKELKRQATAPRPADPVDVQSIKTAGGGTGPELSLTDLNGKTLHTSDYKGKVVLVNFWAAWCTPCAEEVPQFIALQRKYKDEGFQIIGISVEDDAGELRNFYRKYQMNYPVVPGDIKIADAFGGVLGLPTTFVIGRDNLVHGKHNGATDFAAIEQEVVALLHAPQR